MELYRLRYLNTEYFNLIFLISSSLLSRVYYAVVLLAQLVRTLHQSGFEYRQAQSFQAFFSQLHGPNVKMATGLIFFV